LQFDFIAIHLDKVRYGLVQELILRVRRVFNLRSQFGKVENLRIKEEILDG
jgi:hypothetical protein